MLSSIMIPKYLYGNRVQEVFSSESRRWSRCDMLRKTVPDPYSGDCKNSVAIGWESGKGNRQKRLSCRRETARCFVSLNISLSHSRSLTVIQKTPWRSACVSPYKYSIVGLTMSLSCTVSEIIRYSSFPPRCPPFIKITVPPMIIGRIDNHPTRPLRLCTLSSSCHQVHYYSL